MMITPTPRLAEIASSRINWILMTRIVRNPTVSASSATPPGTSSWRNALRPASRSSAPVIISDRNARTICTPWLTPMANTRNGTSSESGSTP